MQKILEKFMKKYWKNAKKTGKVREIHQSKKVGTIQVRQLRAYLSALLMYSKNTYHQGVCNDGGSHVETSSICAALWALYRLVVSSITL